MSRQLEQAMEDRSNNEKDSVLLAVYGGLVGGVERAGGTLCGFTVSFRPGDTLMTIKADFPGGRVVAFVGGDDLVQCLIKGMREAKSDQLQWRADKWAVK